MLLATGKLNRGGVFILAAALCVGFVMYGGDGVFCAHLEDAAESQVKPGPPSRVVCVVPSTTEIILQLGAGDSLVGITYHTANAEGGRKKAIVGGFLHPSPEKIDALLPDLVIVAPVHTALKAYCQKTDVRLLEVETGSIADSLNTIRLMGNLFSRETAAADVINAIQADLSLTERKVSKIPVRDRQRVIRIMGREQVMTPGKDSFQNEMILAAGGVPPDFTGDGAVVPVDIADWKRFNPQVIYGCSGDRTLADAFFSKPGWQEVAAVQNGRIYYFPCDLTCRAGTRAGYFVSWLSSRIYSESFSDESQLIFPEAVTGETSLPALFGYVQAAAIAETRIYDFTGKTLIVDFHQPMRIVSTLEGARSGIRSVGNHYMPPQTWGLGHEGGLAALKEKVLSVVERPPETASFLYTGAHMDHLSVGKASFRDMTVAAYVTAGVSSNALRMSRDVGGYYEPGTINVILLSNMKLSDRAMTRAIITATEAKTAALLDLDVRSSASPKKHRATGTGTDNIIVVEGAGPPIDNAGGHSKMGELIARAVYDGVTEAVCQQNGLTAPRSIFSRLQERRMSVSAVLKLASCDCFGSGSLSANALEQLLLDPEIAGFMEMSLTLSDDYGKGLVTDLTAYRLWCTTIAGRVAGKRIDHLENLIDGDGMSLVMELAWETILTGMKHGGP